MQSLLQATIKKAKSIQFAQTKTDGATTTTADTQTFDESTFDFKLLSKNSLLHTDVLIASATFKNGDLQGTPVPLHCTWYSNHQTQFEQIEGVTTSCYQPSVDDIGKKISVHGVPASDIQEYQGMPMFAEVGPLKIDPQVSEAVESKLKLDDISFNSIQFDEQKTKMTVLLYPNKLQAGLQEVSYATLKSVEVRKNVNNILVLKLHSSEVTHKIQFVNNIERDVFCLVLRQLMSEFTKDPTRMSIQDLFKLKESLYNEQIRKLSEELNDEKACTLRLIVQNSENLSQIEVQTDEIAELQAQLQRANTRESSLQFQLQQAEESCNFYRQELSSIEHENSKLIKSIEKIKAEQAIQSAQDIKANSSTQTLQLADEVNIDNLKSENFGLKSKIQQLKNDLQLSLSLQTQNFAHSDYSEDEYQNQEPCLNKSSEILGPNLPLKKFQLLDPITTDSNDEIVPQQSLLYLMEDNNQMKIELQQRLDQILQYKVMIDEYADKLDQEVKTTQLLRLSLGISNASIFESKKTAQMQELVKHLSVEVTKQNEIIVGLRSQNRQLLAKLDK